MNQPVFHFGEIQPDYNLPVLNERAVRAGAGILFLFAMVSFMNAWLDGNFYPTRLFVVAFVVDFMIRIFVNPSYAPSMIFGNWMVYRQQPEYVGAPQKRFAWSIGLVLACVMGYLVVINQLIGPLNLLICATCLVLLFFESAFGICLGCKLYNLFHRQRAALCPGDSCDYTPPAGGRWKPAQMLIVVAFVALLTGASHYLNAAEVAPVASLASQPVVQDKAEIERCKVPDYAIAMGHEEKWKLHNHCQ